VLPGGKSVTALRLSVDNLLTSPNEAAFTEVIAEHVRTTTGRRASPSEVRSWQRSLPVLARDLADAGLRAVEIYRPLNRGERCQDTCIDKSAHRLSPWDSPIFVAK